MKKLYTVLLVGLSLNITFSQNLFQKQVKTKKRTLDEKHATIQERLDYELKLQQDPVTKIIPQDIKHEELKRSQSLMHSKLEQLSTNSKSALSNTYNFRGPGNLGGRSRAFAIDLSDPTGNTMLAGGVSGGMFRSTNGGANWVRVSPNSDVPNVTCIAQDPRPGFQNIWYYGTGERFGSASLGGASYRGQGIWQSTNGGVTWSKIAAFDSDFTVFDSTFDYINNIVVDPTNGDLLVAHWRDVSRYDGTNITTLLTHGDSTFGWTDVAVTSTGRVYASIEGRSTSANGVYTSATGNAPFTRIAQNGNPTEWNSNTFIGRTVLAIAPSNENIVYALYEAGTGEISEGGLWRYNLSTNTWTDFSDKMPDEPGGDSSGNDPFAVQQGYDLVVNVKPDDENFVVIGGTNAYKIENINDASQDFIRIGGYVSNTSYGLYANHHPDLHVMYFNPFNDDEIFTASDGGIHKADVNPATVSWTSLNNNFSTYQYYHVAIDPLDASDNVMGGAQDNGTTLSGALGGTTGTDFISVFGGDGTAAEILRQNSDVGLFMASQNGNFYRRSNLNGFGFDYIEPTGSSSDFVTYFYLDRDNNDNLYYAGQTNLYRSVDPLNVTNSVNGTIGASTTGWDNFGDINTITSTTGHNISFMCASVGTYNAATSFLLVGTDQGRLIKLNNPRNATSLAGATNITPSGATDGAYVSSIAIHPTNNDIAIVTYSNYNANNIYVTTNLTAANPTWTLAEQNLNLHSIRSSMIAEVDGEIQYYVGTARGLYFNLDPLNEDWVLESPTDIALAVVSSLRYRPSDKTLLIGTHGNGMYTTQLVQRNLSVDEVTANESLISIYPNPTKSTLNISKNSNTVITNFEIYNTIGQMVNYGAIPANNQINVEKLSSGIYFINLSDAKSNSTSKLLKFIKE